MPIEVTMQSRRLHCHAEWDANGHSEPYLWPLFLWIDGATIAAGLRGESFVRTYVPLAESSARGLLGANVEAGDDVTIPWSLGGTPGFRMILDDDLFRRVGLIAVLLEEDDTPGHAIRAGHRAFAQVVHRELNNSVRENMRAPNDEEVSAIAETVRAEVMRAVKDAHSWADGLNYVFGSKDRLLAHVFRTFTGDGLTDQEFSLRFTAHETRLVPKSGTWPPQFTTEQVLHDYELFVQLSVRQYVPDLCDAERTAVRNAQRTLEAIHEQIRSLQKALADGAPVAETVAAIKHLTGTARPQALAELADAQQRLDFCRTRPSVLARLAVPSSR